MLRLYCVPGSQSQKGPQEIHVLSQGATNEILLLPNNLVVRGGFANLAEKFTNIPDPSNFADQLGDIATRKS